MLHEVSRPQGRGDFIAARQALLPFIPTPCGGRGKGDILFLGKRISPLYPQEKGRGECPSSPDIGNLDLEELLSLRNRVQCTWLRHEPLRFVTTLNRTLLS